MTGLAQVRLARGSNWEEIKGKKVPYMDFLHPDGHIMYGLPADPYHYTRYIARGFKPITGEVEVMTQPEPEKIELPEEPQVGFKCEGCGKLLSTAFALAGHARKHTTKEK